MNPRAATVALCLIGALNLSFGQKRTLQPDDYKAWEAISARDISPNGHWMWYQVALVDGDGYLTVKNCDDTRSIKIPDAAAAAFSDDSKWVAFLVGPPKATLDKLRETHQPVETKLTLRNLESGTDTTFGEVRSFHFLKHSHTLLAQRSAPEQKPEMGSDMLVVNLGTGGAFPIAAVTDEAVNEEGTMVAVAVATQGGDQSLELLDPKADTVTPVWYGKKKIRALTWSKSGHALGFLQGTTAEDHEGDFNTLAEVTGIPDAPKIHILDPHDKPWLTTGHRVSEDGGMELSDDGAIVGFGIGTWITKRKPDDKAHPEVWNSKDLRVVPQQRVMAAADRARTELAVWRPATDKVLKISEGRQQLAGLLHGFSQAILEDSTPYDKPASNGFNYQDVYVVDTATGTRKLAIKKTHWSISPSRKGGYFAYFQDKNWWIYNISSGTSRNVTSGTGTSFDETEDDHTVPEKPPAYEPIWLADDAGVVLADDFDSFLVRPTGGTVQLTHGRKDHEVYRLLDPEGEEDGISIAKPFFFSMLDKDDKSSGFYESDATGKGKSLATDKARIGGLKAAKDADRVIFTMGSFENSPNLYVTNRAFSQIKPESKTNPQQAKFYWPKDELVSYKSRWGKPLQGILMYPANYKPDNTYPMVTLIYERLSDGLFNYIGPNPANAYNPQIFLQNGYFVFEPDIAYKGANPGKNAVDCLEPAVAAVLAKHVGVNPAKIGLMGHSWGAYQTAFVTTVSSMFRVGAAGAPLTDLVSMYNTYYWNTGMSNAPILETSQGRLQVPFWEDPKEYIENSPVWQSMKRKSPILVTVGDQDGAVDFHQGMALFNTLRRMGKDCVLLVYYGENHNFTKRPDQMDYGHRLRHYMDVYLKDVKPEAWISEGVPFLKKDDPN